MTRELAVLAAWLHDIGKFAQRADAPATQGMDHVYLPGGGTHRHVLYTDRFIEHDLPLPPEFEAHRSTVARLASAHHRPDADAREETILQVADWLSSGADRMEGDPEGDYKTARMEGAFNDVTLDGRGLAKDAPRPRYPLLPLDTDSPLFPSPEKDAPGSYPALWRSFLERLKDIPLNMGMRAYMSSLVSLLECFTWCIPSSTWRTRADISLFDHAATTAAITQALLAAPDGAKEPFLFFGGDLSGIQAFIFGPEGQSDRSASKLLRARSFFLQALTRSVWLVLLERLHLQPAARIMDAGGRFILLLPNSPETLAALDALEDETQTWLLREWQGVLRLNFARLPLRKEELLRENFSGALDRFNDALDGAKLKPFARAFAAGEATVFPAAWDAYREFGECVHCQARPGVKRGDDNAGVCAVCADLIEKVGAKLPRARYVVFSRQGAGMALFDGVRLRLEAEEPDARAAAAALDVLSLRGWGRFAAAPAAGHFPVIGEKDIERWRSAGCLREEGGVPCFGDDPCEPGAPKTFAMLAQDARTNEPEGAWRCVPYLAACKADVDNLGLIFSIGLAESFSLSRFAMLARMLHFFFSFHLMRLIRREFPDIYVIFAGGDDLFVLGPWRQTIAFARRMREDFDRFCGRNPAVTLSCGLPLFKPALPMRGLREEAEGLLERSKGWTPKEEMAGRGKEKRAAKNAVTLFDVTAPWPEFNALLEKGEWLERECLDGVLTQGLVRRMLGYARDCGEFDRGNVGKGLYLSHLAYDLARSAERVKRQTHEKAEPPAIQRLKELGQDKDTFPRFALSLSWALYSTRRS